MADWPSRRRARCCATRSPYLAFAQSGRALRGPLAARRRACIASPMRRRRRAARRRCVGRSVRGRRRRRDDRRAHDRLSARRDRRGARRSATTASSTRACRFASACGSATASIIQDGAVIGSDGFGFAQRPDGTHHKIPQIGGVVIEDDVEIGAQHDDRSAGRRRDADRRRQQDRQPRADRARRDDRSQRAARRAGRHRRQHDDRGRRDAGGPGRRRRATSRSARASSPPRRPAFRTRSRPARSSPAIRRSTTATGSSRRRCSAGCRSCRKTVADLEARIARARSATRRGLGGAALASPSIDRPVPRPASLCDNAESLCIQHSGSIRLASADRDGRPFALSLIVAAGSATRRRGAAAEARLHDDDAAQRAEGGLSRRSLDADRAHRDLVSRRVEEREAGPHRLRAPVRAHDVQGLEERRARRRTVVHLERRRPEQRLHDRRRDGVLGDGAGAVPAARAVARSRSHGDAAHRRGRRSRPSARSSRKSGGCASRTSRTAG